jgi:hypothetical protein
LETLEIFKFIYINKKEYVSRRWHIPRGSIANSRPKKIVENYLLCTIRTKYR